MGHERHSDPLRHMNDDHAHDLLAIARAIALRPDATAARAVDVDRYGVELRVDTADGTAVARAEFADPIPEDEYPEGVRVAFVRLARQARSAVRPGSMGG